MRPIYQDTTLFYGRLNALCSYWDKHVLGKTGMRLGMEFDEMTQSVRLGYHRGQYDDVLAELSSWRALMARRAVVTEGRHTPLRRHAFYLARRLQDLERMVETHVESSRMEQPRERQR